jgi:NAD(P)H-hydrate repair Nnr-like enzyme with NAD(P)H-hydrate dehydratase domain
MSVTVDSWTGVEVAAGDEGAEVTLPVAAGLVGAGPVTVIVETELQVVVTVLVPEVIVSVTGQMVVVS